MVKSFRYIKLKYYICLCDNFASILVLMLKDYYDQLKILCNVLMLFTLVNRSAIC